MEPRFKKLTYGWFWKTGRNLFCGLGWTYWFFKFSNTRTLVVYWLFELNIWYISIVCVSSSSSLKPGSDYRGFRPIPNLPPRQYEEKSGLGPWSVLMFSTDQLVMRGLPNCLQTHQGCPNNFKYFWYLGFKSGWLCKYFQQTANILALETKS